MDFDTIYAFQLVDEMWANGEAIAAEHCTSIGVNKRGENPTLVAQKSVEKRLRDRAKVVDVAAIKETLSSRDWEGEKGKAPISNASTYASVIMVLSETPTLHIAPGNPHLTAFQTFTFSDKAKTARKDAGN